MTQEKILASEYFNIPCNSYAEFERIQRELRKKSYYYFSSVSTGIANYQSYVEQQRKLGSETKGLAKLRQKHDLRNRVEEERELLRTQGYEMILTQGFDEDFGTMDDDLVAFFCKKTQEEAEAPS